ncbi:MAG: peptide chain release factor 1 [Gammaproteobacteria bacterium]
MNTAPTIGLTTGLINQLKQMEERFEQLETEITVRLSADQNNKNADMRELLSEHGRLRRSVELWRQRKSLSEERQQVHKLLEDLEPSNPNSPEDMRAMIGEELSDLEDKIAAIDQSIVELLRPDNLERHDAILEIRAGTGGSEAGIFAADLLKMYARYAARKNWKWEPVHLSINEAGGCREATVMVGGKSYELLVSEAGVHRVQRIPKTESQGRIHTSTCSVAVLPQMQEQDDIQIEADELRIDTFRASGAGGQHVNKTDSAIRITHLPTGISVECQEDRSQHRNRTMAMAILNARLLQIRYDEEQQKQDQQRRSMIGQAKRAEKIRTYNFPQQRITDHRLMKSFHNMEAILDGDLDELIESFAEMQQQ